MHTDTMRVIDIFLSSAQENGGEIAGMWSRFDATLRQLNDAC